MTSKKTEIKKQTEFNENLAHGIDQVAYFTGMAVGAPITAPIAVVGITAIYADSAARYTLYLPGKMIQLLGKIYESMPLVKERREREKYIPIQGNSGEGTSTKKTKLGQIVAISKSTPGLTQKEALAAAKKRKLRLLTNKEIDAILQNDNLRKEYNDYFPIWTGTHVEYSGTDCTVTELGKRYECEMPGTDDWYGQDEFGMPTGEKSNSGNPNARYLWRVSSYNGLLSRYYFDFGFGRRVVDADFRLDYRLGVLATPIEGRKVKAKRKVK